MKWTTLSEIDDVFGKTTKKSEPVVLHEDSDGKWVKVSRKALLDDFDGTYETVLMLLKCEKAKRTGETIHSVFSEQME